MKISKTNIFRLWLVISCMFLLVACSSKTIDTSANNDQLKKQIADLESENSKLKSQLNEKSAVKTTPVPSIEATPTPILKNTIDLNSALTINDFAEITIKKTNFTTKVEPPNPDSYYTYYQIKDVANIYMETVINVKSLLPTAKISDEFLSVKVKYDGKYEYISFPTIEESGGTNFTYTNITSIEPLKIRTLHFLSELPKEASTDKKPFQIIITCRGNDYIYTLR